MAEKEYRLRPDQIKQLATGYGGCFATDMITIDGYKVGLMYRQEPDNDLDSGWRFLAGRESQEYMDNPGNLAIYDVNTIANYDSEIIPFLDAPSGSAFERDSESGQFAKVEFDPLEDD